MAKYQTDEPEIETGDDFFQTPALEVPVTPPQIHRAIVNGVSYVELNNEKGSKKISISLTSRDVPTLDQRLDIWVPKGFAANVALGSKFDPKTLPEEPGNKQQGTFTRGFANSDKTATLQRFVFNPDSIARRAGRDPIELGLTRNPQTMVEYTENLSKMLSGLEVLMTMREQGGDDPAFKHSLEVKDLFAPDEAELNPKKFKNFQKAWGEQA